MNRIAVAAIGLLLGAASGLRAQVDDRPAPGAAMLGHVSFPTSAAPAAQPAFLEGIALLHSFEYADAAAAFRRAEAADPRFALAYWMEALTCAHLLWGEDDPVAARRMLARLGPDASARLALAGTPRERAYGAAIEAFYADTTLAVRATAFADSMTHLAARDPSDLEASAFAAIALLMAVDAAHSARDAERRDRAITLAERVFRVNPEHPGAAHYLIHAYDDPALAARGLTYARAYAHIAPDAEHALHMPSHIFVQLGLWDDLVTSNERAWAASREWVRRHGAVPAELDFHSLTWLQYGYIQQGRLAAARGLIDTARRVLAGADLTREVDARFVVGELIFAVAAASGDWVPTTALVAPPMPAADASRRLQAFTAIARVQAGYAAAQRRDTVTAGRIAAEYRWRIDASPGGAVANPFLALMAMQLDAAVAMRRGDRGGAIALLREAARIEAASAPVGPPHWVPVNEQLGSVLLLAGRRQDAIAAWRTALRLRPGRREAVAGLARAEGR